VRAIFSYPLLTRLPGRCFRTISETPRTSHLQPSCVYCNEDPLTIRRIAWRIALGTTGACATWLLASCLYHGDDRCGPHQHLAVYGTCLCDDQFVLQGTACVACGEHEVWQAGVCACANGFARATAGAACAVSAGVVCDPGKPASCTDTHFDVCRAGNGVGYCTAACAVEADCPHGFVCDAAASPATCKSSAAGQGAACMSDADCAATDATYCEASQSHVCLVQGCSTSDPLSCSEGWTCCDLHSLGLAKTLCVLEGQCITQ